MGVRRKSVASAVVFAAAIMVVACRDKVAEPEHEVAFTAPSAPAISTAAPPAITNPPREEKPLPEPGAWVGSVRYKLRILDVRPCKTPTADDSASGAATRPASMASAGGKF